MNAASILRRAARVLEVRGKATGDYEWPTGQVCPLGALGVAASQGAEAFRFLLDVLPVRVEHRAVLDAARVLLSVIAPDVDEDEATVEDIIRIVGDWADNASLAEAVAALREAARRAEAVPFAALRRADIVEMGGEEMILLDDAHRDGDTCWTVVQRAGRPTAEKITRPADTVVRLVPRGVA